MRSRNGDDELLHIGTEMNIMALIEDEKASLLRVLTGTVTGRRSYEVTRER